MNNPNKISKSLETIFLGKNTLNSLMQILDPGWKKFDPGSVMEKIRNQDLE